MICLTGKANFNFARNGNFAFDTYADKHGWKLTWMFDHAIQLNLIEALSGVRNILRDTKGYDGCEFYCKAAEAKAFVEMLETA